MYHSYFPAQTLPQASPICPQGPPGRFNLPTWVYTHTLVPAPADFVPQVLHEPPPPEHPTEPHPTAQPNTPTHPPDHILLTQTAAGTWAWTHPDCVECVHLINQSAPPLLPPEHAATPPGKHKRTDHIPSIPQKAQQNHESVLSRSSSMIVF